MNNQRSSAWRPRRDLLKPVNSGIYHVRDRASGIHYVGQSSSIDRRIEQHASGYGARVTSEMKYPEEVSRQSSRGHDTERITTLKLMRVHGAANVFGAGWSARNRSDKTNRRLDRVANSDACFRCGRTNHWDADCYAKTHANGHTLE